ncbi:MAG: F0F1 ATP synthase subunit delta [Candidatus Omnitrophica bacterium]|nr:F0F1 ATP synthase subunit delta [Candidatus Omnitrophota bacterium]
MLIVSLIVIQVMIFGGLIFFMRKILTQNVTVATRHIEELSEEYAKKETEVKRQQEEVQRQSGEILTKARDEAQQERTKLLQEAQAQREKLLQETHTHSEELMQQADKSRQMLLAEINQRIAREAIDKACELIQETLPEQFKLNVHQHWIEELMESGFEQLERLNIPDSTHEVKISSAFPLDDNQRKNLTHKLKEALGREIILKEEINPRIVAGFIILIDSLVLDGSLKSKIQEKARNG